MNDDELVFGAHDLGEPARSLPRSRDLLFLRPAIFGSQQRVAAEGDDRELSLWSCGRHSRTSEVLALERHGHASRSAARARQLMSRDLQRVFLVGPRLQLHAAEQKIV